MLGQHVSGTFSKILHVLLSPNPHEEKTFTIEPTKTFSENVCPTSWSNAIIFSEVAQFTSLNFGNF